MYGCGHEHSEPTIAAKVCIWNNNCVKKQLHSWSMRLCEWNVFPKRLTWRFPCIIRTMKMLQSDPKNTPLGFLSKLQMIFKGIFFPIWRKERTLAPIQTPKVEIIISVFFNCVQCIHIKQAIFTQYIGYYALASVIKKIHVKKVCYLPY